MAALLYLFWLSFDSALNQFILINQQALLCEVGFLSVQEVNGAMLGQRNAVPTGYEIRRSLINWNESLN